MVSGKHICLELLCEQGMFNAGSKNVGHDGHSMCNTRLDSLSYPSDLLEGEVDAVHVRGQVEDSCQVQGRGQWTDGQRGSGGGWANSLSE